MASCLTIFQNFVIFVGEDSQGPGIPNININTTVRNREFSNEPDQKNNVPPKQNSIGGIAVAGHPPLPPVYFTGYTLPPGNPCEGFTLPPPPADKKRTGPRRKFRDA